MPREASEGVENFEGQQDLFIIGTADYLLLEEISVFRKPLSDVMEDLERLQNEKLKERLKSGKPAMCAIPENATSVRYSPLSDNPMPAPREDYQSQVLIRDGEPVAYMSSVDFKLEFYRLTFAENQRLFFDFYSDRIARYTLDEFLRSHDAHETALANYRERMGRLTGTIDELRGDIDELKRARNELVPQIMRRRTAYLIALVLGVIGLKIGASYPNEVREATWKMARLVGFRVNAEKPIPFIDADESKVERLRDLPGLEAVLTASLMGRHPEHKTRNDNFLDPYQVTKHFLDGKFWYSGRPSRKEEKEMGNGIYNGQRIHRFALIGRVSRYLDRNGAGSNRYDSTTLPDAINTLLDYKRLSDNDIKNWIAWTYKHSFGVQIDPNMLTISRNKETQKVTTVLYAPPSDFSEKAYLKVPKAMDGVSLDSMQDRYTEDTVNLRVIAPGSGKRRLLLQSGVSPKHDLLVPANLLDLDKGYQIPLGPEVEGRVNQGEYGYWQLNAAALASAVYWQEEAEANQQSQRLQSTINGRDEDVESAASNVPLNDRDVQILADYLIKGIEGGPEQIQRITDFVQSYRYIAENNRNYDRHLLILLFNGGGDCNNLAVTWSSLMIAAGHPNSLWHIFHKTDLLSYHITGGVHMNSVTVPEGAKVKTFDGDYVVELTGKYPIGTTFYDHPVMVAEKFVRPKKSKGRTNGWEIERVFHKDHLRDKRSPRSGK